MPKTCRTPSALRSSTTARPALISVTGRLRRGVQIETLGPAIARLVAEQRLRRAEVVTGHPDRQAADVHDRVARQALGLHRGGEAAPGVARTQVAILPVGARRELGRMCAVAGHPAGADDHHAQAVGGRVDLAGRLGQDLRERVPVARRRGRGGSDRERPVVTAVELAAADQDDPLEAGVPRGLEHSVEPDHVVRQEQRHEVGLVRRGGEVDRRVHARRARARGRRGSRRRPRRRRGGRARGRGRSRARDGRGRPARRSRPGRSGRRSPSRGPRACARIATTPPAARAAPADSTNASPIASAGTTGASWSR